MRVLFPWKRQNCCARCPPVSCYHTKNRSNATKHAMPLTRCPTSHAQLPPDAHAAQARGRVGEQLVDEGQERHSQKGSLRGARARIEREVGKKKLNHNATTVEDMGEDRGGHDGVGGGQTRGGTEAGPRVQVGCSPLPILHALVSSSSPGCAVAGHDAAASVQVILRQERMRPSVFWLVFLS